MIIGSHSIIHSKNTDADRAFLRDVLKLPSMDVGDGWLIFGLPPSEVAIHPSDHNDVHEFYLVYDHVQAFVVEMKKHDTVCSPVQETGRGLLTHLTLPGGGSLGVYEPKHARPGTMRVPKRRSAIGRRATTRGRNASAQVRHRKRASN